MKQNLASVHNGAVFTSKYLNLKGVSPKDFPVGASAATKGFSQLMQFLRRISLENQ